MSLMYESFHFRLSFAFVMIVFILDYHLFSIMIVQKPIALKNKSLFRNQPASRSEWKRLTKEQKDALREQFAELPDRAMAIMRSMPGSLILVFR